MNFLQNFFIWIRKNIIRILIKQYPNFILPNTINIKNQSKSNINLISSTDNFWVSKNMFIKWKFYSNEKNINLNIYSNCQVNKFMEDHFKDDLIYEIYKKSVLPVQKIDIFRICCVFVYGGIWLDLKSEINLNKIKKIYDNTNSKGILLFEPRKIEVVNHMKNKEVQTFKNVIHNGFFFLPKNSHFLEKLLSKIKKDYLYFQDVVFTHPKQGIMNLTGPHQFTRTFYELSKQYRPKVVSHNDIDWLYCSKYGEFISPLKIKKHYSLLKKLKTIDSKIKTNLN